MSDYTLITQSEELGPLANAISSSSRIGFDIETTSLSPLTGDIRMMQFRVGGHTYLVDLFETKTIGPIADALRNVEARTGAGRPLILGQNLKFEQKWMLHKYGIPLWPIFDTYRASEIVYNGIQGVGHNLYNLYERELGIYPKAKDMSEKPWSGVLSPEHYAYAAEDVEHLEPLYEKLVGHVNREGLRSIAMLEFQAILPESSIELNGFRVDDPFWRVVSEVQTQRRDHYRGKLLKDLPHPTGQRGLFGGASPFNINSHVQVLQSLHRLGATQLVDTNSKNLAMVASAYPVVEDLLTFKKSSKRCSSFGADYLTHVWEDGRLHPEYYPYTGAGRYACVAAVSAAIAQAASPDAFA